MASYFLGMVFMWVAFKLPLENTTAFAVVIGLTGLTMSWPMSNIPATIQDISEPEIRSSADAAGSLVWTSVAALAPWLAGLAAMRYSLGSAILYICSAAWIVSILLLGAVLLTVKTDMQRVRSTMQARAAGIASHFEALG